MKRFPGFVLLLAACSPKSPPPPVVVPAVTVTVIAEPQPPPPPAVPAPVPSPVEPRVFEKRVILKVDIDVEIKFPLAKNLTARLEDAGVGSSQIGPMRSLR